jgi:hypothetical protein
MTKARWIASAVVAAGLLAAPITASAHDGCSRRSSSHGYNSHYDSYYDSYSRNSYYENVYDNSYYAPPAYYGGYAPYPSYSYGYGYRNHRSSRYTPYRYDRYGRTRGPVYYRPERRGGLTVHIGW